MKRKDNKGRVLKDGESQREDGRYEFKYTDKKGKRRSVYSWRLTPNDPYPAGKRKELSLREREDAIKRDSLEGLLLYDKSTLNLRWDLYIENKPELKQSTRTNYKYMYNKYIRYDIGEMQIRKITYSLLKEFFNKLIHEYGFKPASVEVVNTILHPVFVIAVRDGILRINPIDGIMTDLKRSNDWEKTHRHALTEAQQNAFMNYVKGHPIYNKWHPLLTCVLGTGGRIGEILGLRWQDIFWEKNAIDINHSLIYRLQDDGTVEKHINTPKTRNSIRQIPMFSSVKEALKEVRKKQMKEGGCQEEVDGYSGFIWVNRYGNVMLPHDVNRAIQRIVRDYNKEETDLAEKENRKPVLLPSFSCHHLRHTFCSRICENETDLKLIQEIMGHADISTTMDIYNESNMDRKQQSFAKLEQSVSCF